VFFVHHGFDTVNQLEITKISQGSAEEKCTAENVEIFGSSSGV